MHRLNRIAALLGIVLLAACQRPATPAPDTPPAPQATPPAATS